MRKSAPAILPRAMDSREGEEEVAAVFMNRLKYLSSGMPNICPVLQISTRRKHRKVFTFFSQIPLSFKQPGRPVPALTSPVSPFTNAIVHLILMRLQHFQTKELFAL